MKDQAFVTAVLATPRDDAVRLVYADWLEEQGDPRGELLRLAVRLEELMEQYPPPEARPKLQRVREIARLKARFRELRPAVPYDWLLRFQRGWIRQCNLVGHGVKCPRRWEFLSETTDPEVRRCGHCARAVWFCWSVLESEQALRGAHPYVLALAMDRAEPSATFASRYRARQLSGTKQPYEVWPRHVAMQELGRLALLFPASVRLSPGR